MNNDKLIKRIFYVIFIITLLVNMIAYIYLPSRVGLQITLSGELANYVPKMLFVLVAPFLMIITKLFTRQSNNNEAVKILLVSILIFIFNIITILFNVK